MGYSCRACRRQVVHDPFWPCLCCLLCSPLRQAPPAVSSVVHWRAGVSCRIQEVFWLSQQDFVTFCSSGVVQWYRVDVSPVAVTPPVLIVECKLPGSAQPSCVHLAVHLRMLFVGTARGGIVVYALPTWLLSSVTECGAVPASAPVFAPIVCSVRGAIVRERVRDIVVVGHRVYAAGHTGQVVELRITAADAAYPDFALHGDVVSCAEMWLGADPGEAGGWHRSQLTTTGVVLASDGSGSGGGGDCGGDCRTRSGGSDGVSGPGDGGGAVGAIVLRRVAVTRTRPLSCLEKVVLAFDGSVCAVVGWNGKDLVVADVTHTCSQELCRVQLASWRRAHDFVLSPSQPGASLVTVYCCCRANVWPSGFRSLSVCLCFDGVFHRCAQPPAAHTGDPGSPQLQSLTRS